MSKRFTILIIDDDEDDQFLIKSAFEADYGRYHFLLISNAENLLEDKLSRTPVPDLIFLDLNMPGITGFEVLAQLKQSPHYQHIPVIVLSTSGQEQDVNRCYKLGANTYLVKPTSQQELVRLAGLIRLYWFTLARMPTGNID